MELNGRIPGGLPVTDPMAVERMRNLYRQAEHAYTEVNRMNNIPVQHITYIMAVYDTLRLVLGYPSNLRRLAEEWSEADRKLFIGTGAPPPSVAPQGPKLQMASEGLVIDCRHATVLRVFHTWEDLLAKHDEALAKKAAEDAGKTEA